MSEIKRYRLELSFSGRCRDVELSDEMNDPVYIGTVKGCSVRFSRDDFFDDFSMSIYNDGMGNWSVQMGEGAYISSDDLLKLRNRNLKHGDTFSVHYQESGALLCRGHFYREFESKGQFYTRFVELAGINALAIGGTPGCQIVVRDNSLGSDCVRMQRQGGSWTLLENNTKFGMSVNGVYKTKYSVLNDYDFFSIVGYGFFLRGDRLYFGTSNEISVQGITVKEHRDSMTRMSYPFLNKSSRIYYKIPEKHVDIQNPSQKQKQQEGNLFISLMPALSMIVLTIVLRGIVSGGGVYLIMSVCSMGIGIVTSIYNYKKQKTQYEKQETERVQSYTGYIQRKEAEIKQLRAEESNLLEANSPNINTTLNSLWRFDNHIYDKNVTDPDYLYIRLGTGSVESKCPVKYTVQEFRDENDVMTLWPEQLEKSYRNLAQAPVGIDLKSSSVIGIAGNEQLIQNTVRILTADLVIHHSHQNVQLAFLLDKKNVNRWEWVKWLRHVNNPVSKRRNLAYDQDSYKNVVEFLYKEICNREAFVGTNNIIWSTNYVIIVLEPYELMSHPISQYIPQAQKYGFTFIFCKEAEELLPRCEKIIRLQNNQGEIIDTADGNKTQQYVPAEITDVQLSRMAVKMACVMVDEVSLAAQLTKNITLYKLLNIFGVDDLDLHKRWKESEIYKSMAAPLGVNAKGDIIYLDLHEKAHGPHGLVAGTTGSGKSEIMQTYILSMATLFHPYEVAFVIIDFKGGGMVNQFKGLPHLLGAITNIDGKEINRSLKSIKAELQKRQRLFAEADVNHIDKYIKKYKEGAASVPLPHLIIIADEFAELKAEQPEFMKELISAARIGRSLGVHLILATQKPSGVVDGQIWSNSKFKLCLKVQSKEDSNEVIKTPLAAEIKEPGRAYLQVGNNEIFELFQSAYSGAPAIPDLNDSEKEYRIDQIAIDGTKTPIFIKKKQKKNKANDINQLEAIVDYISKYCTEQNIRKLPNMCLPPLPEILPFETGTILNKENICVQIGIYDDPDHQAQEPYVINFTAMNYMIIGSAQTGKTNVLQTIIRSLSSNYSPKEVNIYIMDFGSMILKNYSDLRHVGGVVCSYEDEKLKSLFRMLDKEIIVRKSKLAEAGVSSYVAYKEAGMTDLPQIVVLIDNMTALKELYLQENDFLLPLCRDGVAVGISFVISNLQTSGIGYRYLNNFEGRITLFCNEASEYSMMFEGNRTKLSNVAGRTLVQMDKAVYECHTYLAFEGEKEFERVQAIKDYIALCNMKWGNVKAKNIPEIPKLVTKEYISENFREELSNDSIVLGMNYETILPVKLDLYNNKYLAISGKKDSVKDQFAKMLVESIIASNNSADLYILDDISSKWSALEFDIHTAFYSSTTDAAENILSEIVQCLTRRYEAVANKRKTNLDDESWIVLIIENNDAILEISKNKALMPIMKDILDKYSEMKIFVLFSNIANNAIGFNAPEIMKFIKDNKRYVIFEDIGNIKLTDVSLSLTKKYAKATEKNDAYYFDEGELKKIKVLL